MKKEMMLMKQKGMMAIEVMVIIVLAVVVLAVLVGVIIFGGQQPTSDLGKQTFVRACCQLNMPLTCTNVDQVKCTVPENLRATFGSGDAKNQITLESAADKIGISSDKVKTFCGC
ncbi:MAG: hypothetical protein HY515_02305 [Candidatus Aenigmarchaeota archaeon]|nr:hypothetical protein [Candidatus Aenigmarchaeota archaeon]